MRNNESIKKFYSFILKRGIYPNSTFSKRVLFPKKILIYSKIFFSEQNNLYYKSQPINDTRTAISLNNKNEIIMLKKHLEILKFSSNKVLNKEEIEKQFHLTLKHKRDLESKTLPSLDTQEKLLIDEYNTKLVSLEYLLINFESYQYLCNNENYAINSRTRGSKKIHIIKKGDKFLINLNYLAEKNVYLGIILSRKIRLENLDKLNNLIFIGAL